MPHHRQEENDMASYLPRALRTTVGKLDVLFALLALAAAFVLVRPSDLPDPIAVPLPQLVIGSIAIGTTLVLALVAAIGARIDRRCAEDYAFQLMANAAVIAVTTTMMVNILWSVRRIAEFGIAPPTGDQTVGVMLLAWSAGYAIYRVRGLAA